MYNAMEEQNKREVLGRELMTTQMSSINNIVKTKIYSDAATLGNELSWIILEGIKQAEIHGHQYLLGCPSGRSPLSTYKALGHQAAANGQDMSHVTIVMMDEFVLPNENGYEYCSPDAHFSCARYAHKELLTAINGHLKPAWRIAKDNVWLPDPANPTDLEDRMRAAGGINLFIVAVGGSDGHVAFNPPGSSENSRTRIIELAETTRQDNMGTFPDFTDISEVPKYGVSVGLGTICEFSHHIVMIAAGSGKTAAVKRLASYSTFDPSWPATMIYGCKNAQLMLDAAAANEIS